MTRHSKQWKRKMEPSAAYTERRLACDTAGQRLYAANGAELSVFEVLRAADQSPCLTPLKTLRVQGEITDVTCKGRIVIIAVDGPDRTEICRIRGESIEPLTDLPTNARDVIATDHGVAVLTAPRPGRGSEVLLLDMRSGDLINRVESSAGAQTLRPASGQGVLVVDPRARTVRRVDLDPRCEPERPRPQRPRPEDGRNPDPNDPHRPYGGGCGCCGPEHPDPSGRDPGRVPPRRPPRDFCEDGSDGTQDDCFVYIAAGFSIICRNICLPERPPCRRHLHRPVERIEHLGQAVYAVTRDGSAATVMDARSLSVIEERGLAGPGSLILQAPSAGQLFALSPDLAQLVIINVPQVALDLELDLEAEVSEKLIIGNDNFVAPRGPQFAPEPADVLIVPVTYEGQNYTPAGSVEAYRNALWTLLGTEATNEFAPLQRVLNYYNEQSNEAQPISFTVFGADSPEYYNGGPVRIPQPVSSFYNGSFSPGGMVNLVLRDTSTATIALRGNETRQITAISHTNRDSDGDANEFGFTLRFPAGIARLNLDRTNRVQIGSSGPNWALDHMFPDGTTGSLILDRADLSAPFDRTFEGAGRPFTNEVAELQDALNEMRAASTAVADFDPIEVIWGRRPGQNLGWLYILFRFSGGGDVPRFTNMGTQNEIADFFDMNEGDVRRAAGAIVLDPSIAPDDKASDERFFASYLTNVARIAEIEANAGATDPFRVRDPKLGEAAFSYGDFDGVVGHATSFFLTNAHGGRTASIEPGNGTGQDPLDLANANPANGSQFEADSANLMPEDNKDRFFRQVYGSMIEAVNAEQGGPPALGWGGLKDYLESFRTVYTFPVDAPPPGAAGAWSVDAPGSQSRLRAFVRGTNNTNPPPDIGEPAMIRWGMNFQSFDPVDPDPTDPDVISPRESDTRTFGHEIGHTLGLKDVYSSTKFDPTLLYMGELDLMGSSQANWSHLCAYHKLALGWWEVDDHLAIEQPAVDDISTTNFILVPTEWWGLVSEQAARDAVPGALDGSEVVGVALLDLAGDGGVLGAVEARAPGAEFSADLAPDGAAGQVTVTNILDYDVNGRYGQIIEDEEAIQDLPQAVVDGLLRYRRLIHPVVMNAQGGANIDLAGAPGFPVPGLVVRVLEQGTTMVDGDTVPIYACQVEWTGRRNPDVGFDDREVDWQSSDIAIDYIGEDPNNPQSFEDSWPVGQPQGVGDTVVIPLEQEGIPNNEIPPEPHRVLIRIHNFGAETVRDIRFDVFLKDPGGAGDLGDNTPFFSGTVDELGPMSEGFAPVVVPVPWDVRAGQEPHVCWRVEIRDFRVDTGDDTQVVITDASPTNNWAQQNIFEADVTYESPPEPLESRFSVTNDGPFTERAHLVAEGLPRGARLTVRPAVLEVPPFAQRTFRLRFEFDEEMIDDPCRREMDVLLRCIRTEEHHEELWGASLFKLRLKRKTELTIEGYWIGFDLYLSGQLDPGLGTGNISVRLDFRNGTPPVWLSVPLEAGGVYDRVFDASDIANLEEVHVMARFRGTVVFAPSTSPILRLPLPGPEG